MQKDESGASGKGTPARRTAPVASARTDQPQPSTIVPAEGWEVQSRWGTQKTASGVPLVSFRDAHTWLTNSGVPARPATRQLFAPFLMECVDRLDAPEVLEAVWMLNAQDWPVPVFVRGGLGPHPSVRLLRNKLPELGHVRFAEDSPGSLMYSIAEGALRSWQGTADLSTDPVRLYQDQRDLADEHKHGINWPDQAKLGEFLSRLAVPHSLAHELWGWGSSSDKVVSLQAVKTDDREPTTWAELVIWCQSNTGPNRQWTPERKAILAKERRRRVGVGAAQDMAKDLGISVSRLNGLIKTATVEGKRAGRYAR